MALCAPYPAGSAHRRNLLHDIFGTLYCRTVRTHYDEIVPAKQKHLPPKRLQIRCPRRNLPSHVGGKRGEANFVLAFNRAYIGRRLGKRQQSSFCANREVPVSGFGVADYVFVVWPDRRGANGRGIEVRRQKTIPRMLISAFEMKLGDWKRGLAQAIRYQFFAHRAFLVLPPAKASLAAKLPWLFEKTGVGLIAFDPEKQTIRYLIRVRMGTPRSARAHKLALAHFEAVFTHPIRAGTQPSRPLRRASATRKTSSRKPDLSL